MEVPVTTSVVATSFLGYFLAQPPWCIETFDGMHATFQSWQVRSIPLLDLRLRYPVPDLSPWRYNQRKHLHGDSCSQVPWMREYVDGGHRQIALRQLQCPGRERMSTVLIVKSPFGNFTQCLEAKTMGNHEDSKSFPPYSLFLISKRFTNLNSERYLICDEDYSRPSRPHPAPAPGAVLYLWSGLQMPIVKSPFGNFSALDERECRRCLSSNPPSGTSHSAWKLKPWAITRTVSPFPHLLSSLFSRGSRI